MPRKRGGSHPGKRKKQQARANAVRPLEFPEKGEDYGKIVENCGDRRFMVLCGDMITRMCHVCGRMKKRIWVNVGDLVVVSVRDFEPTKGDINHCYSPAEASVLESQGKIPEGLLTATAGKEEEEDAYDFGAV